MCGEGIFEQTIKDVEKIKILQINAVCGIASTGRLTQELAEAIEQAGHQSFVAYSMGTSNYSQTYLIGNWLDKKVHTFLSRIFGLPGHYSFYSTRKLLKYIETLSPDIVHLGNLHSNFVNIPMLLKYLASKDIATVVTLHDCFFYTGKCCHYTITGCYRWQEECGKCPRVHQDNISWFFDRTKKMLTDKKVGFQNIPRLAIVGVSQWVANEALKSILSTAKYIVPIYNWVDISIFKPTASMVKNILGIEQKFVILGVSTLWSESKGISDFKALAKKLDENACIVLVGKMSGQESLPNNIISIPNISNMHELVKYYSMADVFFNPSIEETFGNVTAEALACGTPVIVYNTTACPELVGERCGAVVDLHDVDTVYSITNEIHKKTKKYYSKYAVEFAHNNFEKEVCIQKYLDLYNLVLK